MIDTGASLVWVPSTESTQLKTEGQFMSVTHENRKPLNRKLGARLE